MFVLTTYHPDQSDYHPGVRFFRDVNRAKEVARRFMDTLDEDEWEVNDHSDGLRGYSDNDGDVRVERIKFEDDK